MLHKKKQRPCFVVLSGIKNTKIHAIIFRLSLPHMVQKEVLVRRHRRASRGISSWRQRFLHPLEATWPDSSTRVLRQMHRTCLEEKGPGLQRQDRSGTSSSAPFESLEGVDLCQVQNALVRLCCSPVLVPSRQPFLGFWNFSGTNLP